MKRKGLIKYPKHLNAFAKIVGEERQRLNEGITKGNLTFDRGAERNIEFHITGALGELAFDWYLNQLEIPHICAPLIDPKPVATYDVKIKGNLLDVKTINKMSQYYNVNKRSHDKPDKEITHYVFLKPEFINTFTFEIIDKIKVNDWDVHAFNEKNKVYRRRIDANL
jgi:hypothetical protein